MNQKKLGFLFCAVYFVSYITRMNYAAVLAEIIVDLGISKQLASIAVTGSFITYGIGQVFSGVIGDKFKAEKVILFGVVGTSVVNLSMVFLPNIYAINALWCVNGFFQSLLWPPLVRLVSEYFSGYDYAKQISRISQASYIATVTVYALSPFIIHLFSWKGVFAVFGSIGAVFSIIWYMGTKKLCTASSVQRKQSDSRKIPMSVMISSGMIPIFLATVFQGFLKDGLTTWMPTYITEVFNLDTSVSILSTTILPIFSVLSLSVITRIGKAINNEVKSAFVFFVTALCCNIVIIALFSKFAVLDITAMALITSCMHGVNIMLVGNVPVHFHRFGKVSTISGIINSATYIGSAVSTYAFALISDKFGWNFTVSAWAIIASLGAVLCLTCIRKWKGFRTND